MLTNQNLPIFLITFVKSLDFYDNYKRWTQPYKRAESRVVGYCAGMKFQALEEHLNGPEHPWHLQFNK